MGCRTLKNVKLICNIQCNHYENFNGIFHRNRKISYFLFGTTKDSEALCLNTQNNLRKNKARGIILSDFKP